MVVPSTTAVNCTFPVAACSAGIFNVNVATPFSSDVTFELVLSTPILSASVILKRISLPAIPPLSALSTLIATLT